MTDYPAAQNLYNSQNKPFNVFDFLSIYAPNKSTGTVPGHFFSTRARNETVIVQNPVTDADSSRAFLGGKHIVKVPPIKDTQGLTVDIHEFEFAFNSPQVKDMIGGYYLAGSYFEWHQGQANKRGGGLLVARPVCEMFGIIHDVRERRGAKNKESGLVEAVFVLTVSGRHSEFEDANNAFRSEEEGMKRSGDKIFRYTDNVADWPIGWGKEIHRHKDHGNRGDGKDKGEGKGETSTRPRN